LKTLLKNSSISLKYYILVPLIVILTLQIAIFGGGLWFSGAHDTISDGLYNVLENTVSAKSNAIEAQLTSIIDASDFYNQIDELVTSKASELELGISEYLGDDENRYDLLDSATPIIAKNLYESGATSCFIMLDNESIYLRTNPSPTRIGTYADIMAVAGDITIIQKYLITPDTYWTATLDTNKHCTFYQTTYNAGNSYKDLAATDLGYMSELIRIHDNDTQCLTYSIPLLDENHNSYGVIGFDISLDQLKEMISNEDLKLDNYSSYYLGITTDYTTIESICVANDSYYAALQSGSTANLSLMDDEYSLYNIYSDYLYEKTSACIFPIRIYSTRSPYYDNQWVIAGLLNTKTLYASYAKLNRIMLFAMILAFLLSIGGMFIIFGFVMRPISLLNKGVPKLAPGYYSLPRTNIKEFDTLSSAIEEENVSIYKLGNRMSEIIDIAGIDLAVCELNPDLEDVYCTHKVFDILEISDSSWAHNRINQSVLICRLKFLQQYLVQDHENADVYKLQLEWGASKWLEIKQQTYENSTLIVITDITQTVLDREKIIHDRDYDILTGLLNRGAFIREMKYMIDEKHCESGILSIWDLDNLKYTNDSYGHEIGDKYICTLSDLLKAELPPTSISARLAGDEFTIFLYNEPTDVMIKRLIKLHDLLMQKRLSLPDGNYLNMSASAGYAFYANDADNYAELFKYADFAMYQIKKTSKGSIKAFSRDSYVKDYILVQGVGELDRIIADEAIRYAYQPIISVNTGKIFAYEALIRPMSDLLGRPDNLLRVSMAQSKLDKIERITWFHALEGFFSQIREGDNARIFINSIPNQLLSDDDWTKLERLYGRKLSRIVMEITEEAKSEIEMDEKKRAFCKKWNIPVALDDYGSGYSNSDILVSRIFHFVKLDMSLIHNIDKKQSTQSLVKSIIEYCHENSLMVIAEGVETEVEFDKAKELGADFVQGFYFARPSYVLYNDEIEQP
jgi:diguanylate cyclase (GGDEF)-like protein